MLDRDQILEATDLAALADELLGPRRGTPRSASWPCPSPTHAQTGRTPPVSIYRSRNGEERWHCHGCGIGGSAVDLVMVTRGVLVRDALEELARRAGGAHRFHTDDVSLSRPFVRRQPAVQPAVSDPAGLAAYVEECAERLWQPEGRVVLRWLTDHRGLPEDVLRSNGIGADPGRQRQARPEGLPSAGRAAVLPVSEEGRPVFVQIRSLSPPPGRPRYMNASNRLAANPRLGIYEPPDAIGRCVIVTEGVLDALSANAAGFRAAAVLGAALVGGDGCVGGRVVERLTRCEAPMILAFDADPAGEQGATLLQRALRERGTFVARVHVPIEVNDLNGWMVRSRDWQRTLGLAVRTAVTASRPARSLAR
ncbi:MAG TPA: toprim domain-containing protein [Acidimicrobiales bacterium]|nr:toprim domain-containing protein [Acidimicrobiales bacterium]